VLELGERLGVATPGNTAEFIGEVVDLVATGAELAWTDADRCASEGVALYRKVCPCMPTRKPTNCCVR